MFKHEVPQAKKSELKYHLKMILEQKCLLEVEPITGRSHQIRAQLSSMGCTIIGDTKYGYRGKSTGTIGLHARGLQFEHPVKREPLLIEAPVPIDPIWKAFASV